MNTIAQDIEALRTIIGPVLSKHTGKRLFLVEWTFLHVLERVDTGLLSLHTLVSDDFVKHEHAIGLISRTLLSDFLIIGHLVRASTQSSIESTLMPLFRRDIEQVHAHVRRYVDNGDFTIEEYKEYVYGNRLGTTIGDLVDEYYKKYPDQVKTNGKVKRKEWPSNSLIAEQAMQMTPRSGLAVNLYRAYDQWFMYAKYEHLGWHSFVLTRTINRDLYLHRLKRVLLRTSVLVSLCLEMLDDKETMEISISLMNRLFDETPIPTDKEANPEEDIRRALR